MQPFLETAEKLWGMEAEASTEQQHTQSYYACLCALSHLVFMMNI